MEDMKTFCALCGRTINKPYFSQEMHAECTYALKRARMQAKYHEWNDNRRSLYFKNIWKAMEATRDGKEVCVT